MFIKYLLSKIINKINISSIKNCIIDKRSKICSGSNLVKVNLGKYSYIGNYCTIVSTKIGNFCSIADNCIIGGANHPISWASTSPVFLEGKCIIKKKFSNIKFEPYKRTNIGNDVWIGSNCLVKGGVSIADGAIIGMGSVVTKSVGPYEIWAGNPAKIIRKRFEDEMILKYLEVKWWLFDDDKLSKIGEFIIDSKTFLEKVKGLK